MLETQPVNHGFTIEAAPLVVSNDASSEVYEGSLTAEELFSNEMDQYPLLSAEQERLAFEYIGDGLSLDDLKKDPSFQSQDPEILEKIKNLFRDSNSINDLLLLSNLRLVVHFARRNNTVDLMDAIQEGSIALVNAIEKFDHSRGLRLSTYAGSWILNGIKGYEPHAANAYRLPIEAYNLTKSARRIKERFLAECGREMDDEELKESLVDRGATPEMAQQVILHLSRGRTMYTGQEIKSQSHGRLVVGDILPDNNTARMYDEAVSRADFGLILPRLREVLSTTELRVLLFRFGFDGSGGKSLAEIGSILNGLTRERIRQIEKEAMEKLKAAFAYEIEQNSLLS